MVLKFLTAGLLTAAIAAGAVYFWLDEEALSSLMPEQIERVVKPDDLQAEIADTTREVPTLDIEPEVSAPAAQDDARFSILLAETAKLDIIDARNDAYLNILDLAITEERYEIAREIVDNITVPELRDTARQRIGISHARAGRLEEAFAVLDDLDIEALSDPIRLEIIRSVARKDR